MILKDNLIIPKEEAEKVEIAKTDSVSEDVLKGLFDEEDNFEDNLNELKTICSECDKKATMVVRLDSNGKVLLEGEKILIGGNEIYKTLCRKHFRELTKLI